MIRKYKVRVQGKEYAVEVEAVGEIESEGSGSGKEKKISIKEKEPFGKFESLTTKEKSILAPMPAKVVKVNCKAGERVRRGEVLIILEAMKMENEIPSPADGVIREVRVKEGTTVSHDEVMVVFE